jgi:hypothetical protein
MRKTPLWGVLSRLKRFLHFSSRSDAMISFLEVASHGCMMIPLAQRLLRIDRAPGFGRSSRIAIGKEAASNEDRRGRFEFAYFFVIFNIIFRK